MSELNQEFKSFVNTKLPKVAWGSVEAVIQLTGEGATIPFIARYRKEKTGNLSEVEVRDVIRLYEKWDELVKRKKFIIEEVEKQGNMTPELKLQISASQSIAELEELYRPFKRKKKTKAKLAKEAGLLPFSEWIWRLAQGDLKDSVALEIKAKEYINPTAGFATYDEVLRGAQHIIVEKISNHIDLRNLVKQAYWEQGEIQSKVGKKYKTHSKFDKYQDYKESIKSLSSKKASHRYLALRRGWQEDELVVTMQANDEELLKEFEAFAVKAPHSQVLTFMKNCAKVALTVHVIPSVTNEIHGKLKEEADISAIQVFAENVRRVLMASPFGSKIVLGVDPGLRTGCKMALVDSNGRYISSTVIYTQGEDEKQKAKKLFEEVFKQIKIDVIAVGNGTGGREAEVFIRDIIREIQVDVPVILVNEAGASVYSASDIAREEFPDLDLTVRGAISIARRLQDPLAELVKIEPKSIGVGQYQHDVSQNQLKKALHEVVESCVNQVGVNLNTASESLLQYISGIGPAIAKNIVQFRQTHGLFKEREELNKVTNFSSKVFQQASGFLRIPDSKITLDRTGIHPERYMAVKDMAHELGVTVSQLLGEGATQLEVLREKWEKLIGKYTFNDILDELRKPGRDPRDPYQLFKFREDIHEIKDLKQDMICPGIVTNVTNFGAFVDVGVHQDGLVHLSEISHTFIEDPKTVLSPGDQVQVKVLDVDVEKKQISFTMLLTVKPKPAPRPRVDKAKSQRPLAQSRRTKEGVGTDRKGEKSHSKPPDRFANKKGKPGSGRREEGGKQRGKPFNNPFAELMNIKKS